MTPPPSVELSTALAKVDFPTAFVYHLPSVSAANSVLLLCYVSRYVYGGRRAGDDHALISLDPHVGDQYNSRHLRRYTHFCVQLNSNRRLLCDAAKVFHRK